MARNAERETSLLTKAGFDLARSMHIERLLVQADELSDIRLVEKLREQERILWVTRSPDPIPGMDRDKDITVEIPDADLNRMSQLRLALFLSVLNGHLTLDETILCLTGPSGAGRLDMMLITNPGRSLKRMSRLKKEFVATRDLARLLDVALRFAVEGREGKPIGTVFVLGDPKELEPYLRQLVLNPCRGHRKAQRNIHNRRLLETLREFAAMDGGFVVSKGGAVESAATYFDAPVRRARLRKGHGARHAAALAITAETSASAVVLSSSSGMVTVFHGGKIILELERPAPLSARR